MLHERNNNLSFKEFVSKTTEPTYIEPLWGYCFTEKGNLIEDVSKSLSSPSFEKAWHYAIPATNEFFKIRNMKNSSNVIYFPKVISLRYFWEWNYYHFYLDVLGKLALLDSLGFDPSIPLILGGYANELPFVKQIINMGKFRNRNWIIQDKNYVFAHEVIYCFSNQTHKQKVDYLLDNLDVSNNFINFNKKTFLTRGPRNVRHIINMPEIENLLTEYGFNIVDTEGLPLSDQIEIFSKTGMLIGIHGAGMTNLIFRGSAPLKVLELCSRGKKPSDWTRSNDFMIICKELGHFWDELRGEPDNNIPVRANFTIDRNHLEHKIIKMLNEDH